MLGSLAFLEHNDFPADQLKHAHALVLRQRERERERKREREREHEACTNEVLLCVLQLFESRFFLLQVVEGVLVVKETFVWSVLLMSLFLRDRMAVVAAPVFAPLTLVTASNGPFCKS